MSATKNSPETLAPHSDNIPANPRARTAPTIGDVIEERLSRRGFMGGVAAASALAVAGCAREEQAADAAVTAPAPAEPAFGFDEIARGLDETIHAPAGYRTDVLLRWGDPIFEDAPAYAPEAQTAAAQERQFGYNCDFIGYVPLEPEAGQEARALLCVNHEYTSTNIMLPGVVANYPDSMTKELCEVEMAGHGGSVVEIAQVDGVWSPVLGSTYNRRITATTPMEATGPAAGHPRMKTSDDPEGRTVLGMVNNCAGGITPWGTYLSAEENFNSNFLGDVPEGHPEAANHKRYSVPGRRYQWGRHFDRFNVGKEPNAPNRYGWVVEIDPMDPTSTPKKRTALGRFKHEGAESVVAPNGRLVVYMGDDQRFDYVYKFVSARAVNTEDRAANADLLDEGTLYVARFDADGTVAWLPLIHGEGPLTSVNGFNDQGDVMIETRRAADLLGATPMDRPEDVEPDPARGRVWLMLTNNSERKAEDVDAANPRGPNRHGHIIEMIEPDGDFTAEASRWEFLVKCGDPSAPEYEATWNPATTENGWFGSPDNCAVDPSGRLWVATDGNSKTGAADGLWAMETEGERRGTGRAFFRTPVGAELCGPRFAPDGKTLFVAVQHPGSGSGATYENPKTRWPDFEDGRPPRPSVVAIQREDGGEIGA